jgi:hypothetical protein
MRPFDDGGPPPFGRRPWFPKHAQLLYDATFPSTLAVSLGHD